MLDHTIKIKGVKFRLSETLNNSQSVVHRPREDLRRLQKAQQVKTIFIKILTHYSLSSRCWHLHWWYTSNIGQTVGVPDVGVVIASFTAMYFQEMPVSRDHPWWSQETTFIKSWYLNTHLSTILCDERGSTHKAPGCVKGPRKSTCVLFETHEEQAASSMEDHVFNKLCSFRFGYLANILSKINEVSLSTSRETLTAFVTEDTISAFKGKPWFWKTRIYHHELLDSFPTAKYSSKEMRDDIRE